MPVEKMEKSAATAVRLLRVGRGAVKEMLLPKNVVFVVHKPGHQKYRKAVEQVYEYYGITPLGFSRKRFGKRSVVETYKHVLDRLAKERPGDVKRILDAYSAKGLCHRNIAVELLHLPKKAINAVKAGNAWEAMKKIAGKTDPDEAMRIFDEKGAITLRGATQHYVKSGELKGLPPLDRTRNLVHVPDPQAVVLEKGRVTGRLTDLDIFLNSFDVGRALKNYWRLKRKGGLE
ncbi:MAG: hypothetical protein NTY90_04950 [Candidatus Micrarchaeota archaeon]|nr:hypothetical protein [Candidatus Micrarchaeota archaeon]